MKQHAIIVRDLGYGDQGKGTITDYLARVVPGVHTVIRDNGGSQAAHNVVLSDGRKHTFSQFGSATFVPGVTTHLSRFMLVNPQNLIREEKHLREKNVTDAFDRLFVDRNALIITDLHRAANRLRELHRGESRHGSCGEGVGETADDALVKNGAYALYAKDLLNLKKLKEKLRGLQAYKIRQLADIIRTVPKNEMVERELVVLHSPQTIKESLEWYEYFVKHVQIVPSAFLKKTLQKPGTVMFEGAQGVLLDETYGFHPYVTSTNTTSANAQRLLRDSGYRGRVFTIGVLRAYSTRHGPGPFVTQDDSMKKVFTDEFNKTGVWQREFRVGHFDAVAARYAIQVNGDVDCLAVTCLDQLYSLREWKVCTRYLPDVNDQKFFKERSIDTLDFIRDIRVNARTTPSYQQKLGQALNRVDPVYATLPAQDKFEYLGLIERELQVPIEILSVGQDEQHKAIIKI